MQREAETFSQIDLVICITVEGRMRSESLEVHELVLTEMTKDAVLAVPVYLRVSLTLFTTV